MAEEEAKRLAGETGVRETTETSEGRRLSPQHKLARAPSLETNELPGCQLPSLRETPRRRRSIAGCHPPTRVALGQ